jgi:signal transduction histidine kinase/FixJ family two-component response regulator
MVEDSPVDAKLLAMELERAGFDPEVTRIETRSAFGEAMDDVRWDIVIADYRLPSWSGLGALKLMQEREIDLPFIIVSGTVGEDAAVEAMKAGAHDYVLKDNLVRLGPAVERELREAQVRRERRQALAALRELAHRSTLLAEVSRKLAVSLNYDETLGIAARVLLPEIADWCLLTVVEERPRRLLAVLCHTDPDREAVGRSYLEGHPLDLRAERGPAQVIRSAEMDWTNLDSALVTNAPSEDAAIAAQLGHGSGLCLPLVAQGTAMGALTLVRTSADRAFKPEYVGFAKELAARISMALHSAQLYRQAREAIRARDEFLSVASHELNTPLGTLMLQFEEALLPDPAEQPGGPVSERRRVAIARARRQLDRLSRLVSSLLDVSRVTAKRLQLELTIVDLSTTAREVGEQFAAELARVGCTLRIDAPAPVVGNWDAMRMAQIVANLLSNACKYGPGKPIDVTVRNTGDRARLTVRDQGIGIAAEDLTRIFECFERGTATHEVGGLGLGLYITRQLVEAHGGEIRVRSEPGAGSTFAIELPLHPKRLP